MADSNDTKDNKAEVSAEKAYAAAAEAITGKDAPETPEDKAEAGAEAGPVEFPAKPKRARKPAAVADAPNADDAVTDAPADAPALDPPAAPEQVVPEQAASELSAPEPAADEPVPVLAEIAPAPPPSRPRAVAKPAKPAKVVAKPVVKRRAAKPAVAKPSAAKPAAVKAAAVKPAAAKPAAPKTKTAPKAAKPFVTPPRVSGVPKPNLIAQLKEIPMDMTANVKEAVNGAQEKAKEAFTKTSAAFGEYGEFAKGNVEALVESSKILASGLQDMSSKFLADSKAAFETTVSDVKELSAAKTPTDFLKLQTEVMRRNFDSAIAYGSKTSEAVLKLTNDVFAPISGRVSLAVDKVRKAA